MVGSNLVRLPLLEVYDPRIDTNWKLFFGQFRVISWIVLVSAGTSTKPN
jgi:hypothetical protein